MILDQHETELSSPFYVVVYVKSFEQNFKKVEGGGRQT